MRQYKFLKSTNMTAEGAGRHNSNRQQQHTHHSNDVLDELIRNLNDKVASELHYQQQQQHHQQQQQQLKQQKQLLESTLTTTTTTITDDQQTSNIDALDLNYSKSKRLKEENDCGAEQDRAKSSIMSNDVEMAASSTGDRPGRPSCLKFLFFVQLTDFSNHKNHRFFCC
jgi:hypothetical protein